MNQVISTGDHVSVTLTSYSLAKKPFKATVIGWTASGKLQVKTETGATKTVSSNHVKKLADKPKTLD